MKRNIIFPACIILLSITTIAQTSTQRIYIKGGNSARENFMNLIYMYPSFEQGIVEYQNGQRFQSSMNYNRALGTIQFISDKGDTLSMSNEETIAFISIGNDKYVYGPMCLQVVRVNEKVSLLKHEAVKIADKLKTGAYGIPNSAGTIESIDRLDTRGNYNQIEINENLLVTRITTYYVEDEKGEILVASKKNILNIYPKKEAAVKSYIKENSVDFSREEHLINLVDFLSKN
jgi:hypothetical protein